MPNTIEQDRATLFEALGVTEESLKQSRLGAKQYAYAHCDACGKERRISDIQKCAKCKVALYCSKECQRADWTVHKTRCGALELGGCHENLRRLKRFMRMVAGCPPVDQRLSTYISSILDFIALPPDARIPDEPLGVDIEIDVEPTDFSKALELMKAKGDLSDDSDRGPIEGIFQIGFIEPRRELSFDEIRMWKSSRKQCEECGHKNCTSVIIKYRLHGVVMHAFQHVTKEMLKAERQELQDICKRIHAAMKGTLSFTKSDEEGALFKAMNIIIRMDETNQFKFRTVMTDDDIKEMRRKCVYWNNDPSFFVGDRMEDLYIARSSILGHT